MTDNTKDDDNVVKMASHQPEGRTYKKTMISNSRRYEAGQCTHRGPYIVDAQLATVECQDCGASLNPMYVLELLAAQETYWNTRQKDLSEYLKQVNKELEDRTRTRCTHCGNMTAIRLKKGMPQTWVPRAY